MLMLISGLGGFALGAVVTDDHDRIAQHAGFPDREGPGPGPWGGGPGRP